MVEKIIINPNKVRGYGNIVSSKSASDFKEYCSSLVEGTDTVMGVTSKVFTLTETILLYDGGTTAVHTDVWNYMSMFTRGSDGTSAYYSNTGSSTYQDYTSQTSISGNAAIDFELVECTSCPIQVARYATGASTQYEQKTFTQAGKVHIEIKDTGTYIYFNGTLIQSNTAQTNMESIRLFIRVTSGNTADFKYKDLRIYYI